MRVLIGCESSGMVRQAFRNIGHDAWSCDFLESEDRSPYHIVGDVIPLLFDQWDLAIFHPPCTFLSSSGMHWTTRGLRDPALTDRAVIFCRRMMQAPIEMIAIENPIGVISTRIRKPDQIIQPHQFGHDASKATCLWLKNLPPLIPTGPHIAPRIVVNEKTGKAYKRWANQTDSGQNKLGPSDDRWKVRSKTYSGIAEAFAVQWGGLK